MKEVTAIHTTPRALLEGWFSREPGRTMLAAATDRLNQILPNLFGYHILQLSRFGGGGSLVASRISHRVYLNIDPGSPRAPSDAATCLAGALPIASDSVDVVVLPYVLEFEPDPHQVLREVERVLIGEGHVVIVGFNPWSLWGLWRLALAWGERPPWCGRFLGANRLKDWLQLLGFEVRLRQSFFFRPPLRTEVLLRRLGFMEKLGRYLLPAMGGGYAVVARKRLERLIPIKTEWRARRSLIASGIIEPSTRSPLPYE